MKKVLFIVPHLSTGGMPQYSYDLMRKIINDVDVYCIEYTLLAWNYVVQRNRIKNLLSDKFYAEFENKLEILSIIDKIKPDIIHFQELPEYFMDDEIASKIYSKDRSYLIVETSHDSSFNASAKRHYPDQFALISEFQRQNFLQLNIPISIVEADIEYKQRQDRNEGLKKLDLDPSLKHVLNVGLFTSRKNQKEIFEYAEKLIDKPIQFHFVGNLADNFKSYWEPLIKDCPSNIKIWGERDDVDNFYSCMDLFLFTSRGNDNDKETSPLVIREAIGYELPSLIYNLPVYMDMYDKYNNINYLDFNDLGENINKILNTLNIDYNKNSNYCDNLKIVTSISTYSNNNYTIEKTIDCINAIRENTNYDIICTDHKIAPKKLINLCDYYFYDVNNILTHHDFYNKAWINETSFKIHINLKSSKNDTYHGPAVHQNIFSGVSIANMLKYDYAICFNFDFIMNKEDSDIIKKYIHKLENSGKNAFFLMTKEQEGMTLKTVFFITKPAFYLGKFENIKSTDDYNDLVIRHNSESNGLENLYYNILKYNLNDILIENISETDFFNTSFTKNNNSSKSFTSSQTQYSAVLPIINSTNDHNVALIYRSINNIDLNYKWEIYENDIITHEYYIQHNIDPIEVLAENKTKVHYNLLKLDEFKKYSIVLKDLDSDVIIKKFDEIDTNDIKQQGSFEWNI